MSPLLSLTKSPVLTGFVNKTKKVLKWFLYLVVLIGCILIYWKYFYTYSEGYRAGLLQKFSHKGVIFKTYEGEMILSSVSSNRDVAIASEKFLFTVTNKKDFIWHVVPRMKSPVALHPGTWPDSMHLPPLFVFHLKPHLRLVRWF